ncbi:helix-turn-helix domain-containing protein [Nocardia sp.]
MPQKRPPNRLTHSGSNASDEPSITSPARSDDEVWLSSLDVSQRLKIPIKTLASWASAGRGPRFARMGRYRRYRLSDLLAWEQEQLARGGGARDGSRTRD